MGVFCVVPPFEADLCKVGRVSCAIFAASRHLIVEPICAVLTEHGCQITPSTYYEHVGRGASERECRDALLVNEIRRVHADNYGVYGTRKVWLTLNRGGVPVARCTVERLMRQEGLAAAVRGKVKRTTIADSAAQRPDDLVSRRFAPLAPDRLWVADFTYVSTWSGWVYVAFVADAYARRILGWSASTSMTTDFVLHAFEQAVWTRNRYGTADFTDLIHHHDRGSQYTSIRFGEPWLMPVSRDPLVALAIRMTMPSRRASMACTRPN